MIAEQSPKRISLLDRIAHNGMTRRGVGRWSTRAAMATGFALLVHGSLSEPQGPPVTDMSETFSISPGWIEANIDKRYLNGTDVKSYMSVIRQGILNNPQVKELTSDLFTYLLDLQRQGKRAALGDTVEYVLTKAREKLQVLKEQDDSYERAGEKSNTRNISPAFGEKLDIEAIHMSMYALAGVFSPNVWSREHLEEVGVSLKQGETIGSYFWSIDGLGTTTYPLLFPDMTQEAQEYDRNLALLHKEPTHGPDHMQHVIAQAIVAFGFKYVKEYKLEYMAGIKNIVWYINSIKAWVFNGDDEARSVAEMAGPAYEVISTGNDFKNEAWEIFQGHHRFDRTEGKRDPGWFLDERSDQLGVEIGLALWDLADSVTSQSSRMNGFIRELNDEKFTKSGTEPKLESVKPYGSSRRSLFKLVLGQR